MSHVIDGFGHMKEVKLLEQVLFDLRDRGKLLKDICVMGALARARGELGDVDGKPVGEEETRKIGKSIGRGGKKPDTFAYVSAHLRSRFLAPLCSTWTVICCVEGSTI